MAALHLARVLVAPRGTRHMWGDVVAARMRAVGAGLAQGLGLVFSWSQALQQGCSILPQPPACPWDTSWQSWECRQFCWWLCLLPGDTVGWGGFHPAGRDHAPWSIPQRLLRGKGRLQAGRGQGSPPPPSLGGCGQGGSEQGCGAAPEPLFVIHRHIPRTQQPRTAVPREQRDTGIHATGKHPRARRRPLIPVLPGWM